MKTYEFIRQAIGTDVYVTGQGDLACGRELSKLIYGKIKLKLIKLTKSGNAYLHDEEANKFYSVPPSNVREYTEGYYIGKMDT